MKLLQYGPKGQEKPGLLDANGTVRDLSGTGAVLAGEGVSLEALEKLRAIDPATLPAVADPGRIGACLADVPNFYCIGLNYAKHAQEAGMALPDRPIIFNKASSCLSGPNDPVIIPKGSQKTDWEVELGIVIGKLASNVSEDDALNYVAGYCLVNDMSEREWQLEHGAQWVNGKSAPSFGPTGPYLVTADEVDDVQNLDLSLSLNGEQLQNSNTSDMVFSVAQIVSAMSQYMALRPGDLIATGTPSGVGMGLTPPRYLQPGDVLELQLEGMGTQRYEAVAAAG